MTTVNVTILQLEISENSPDNKCNSVPREGEAEEKDNRIGRDRMDERRRFLQPF
jgi:hypothetical protein